MQPRTKRQREILNYIIEFKSIQGYEPSYQQIAEKFGLRSKSGIAKHIEALEKKGLLSRERNDGKFHLELIPQKNATDLVCEIEWLHDPLIPKTQIEQEYLYVPKLLLGYISPSKLRALMIKDNAMRDEHICEDDIALFETKTFARDGEIIVALIGKSKILARKFYRKGANIELAPANQKFETLIEPADKVEILGVFRGLLRPMF